MSDYKIMYNYRELVADGWSIYDIHDVDFDEHEKVPGFTLAITTPKGKTKHIAISRVDLQRMLSEINERLNPPKKNLAYGVTTKSVNFKFSDVDREGNAIPSAEEVAWSTYSNNTSNPICTCGSCGCR